MSAWSEDSAATQPTVLLGDLHFPEGPRFRDGRLLFSDFYAVFACMLGGDDRRTLFLCTAMTSGPKAAGSRTGRIERVRVEVPGAGLP